MPQITFDDLPDAPKGGLSFDDLPSVPAPDTATDIAKSAGTGLVKGALSLPTTLSDLSGALDYGLSWAGAHAADKLGLLPPGKTANDLIDAAKGMNLPAARFSSPTSQDVLNVVQQDVTGPLYQPQTNAGKYAESVGTMAPTAMLGGGGIARGLLGAVGGGVGSEALGQRFEGTPYEGAARLVGGMVGGNLPGVASRVVTPLPAAEGRLPLIALAEKYNVPLTAGDITGNKALQAAESMLGNVPGAGGKYEAAREATNKGFTQAVLDKANAPEGVTVATPENVTKVKNNLKDTYNDIFSKGKLDLTNDKLGKDISSVADEYDTAVNTAHQNPIVHREIKKLLDTEGSTLSGQKYQNIRGQLQDLADQWRGKPEGTALQNLKGVLDEHMAAALSPEDAKRLADNNRAWAVYKTIVDVVNKPGELTQQGYLSPAAIRTAASNFNPDAYAAGNGPLAELGRLGGGLLRPLPSSQTAERLHALHGLQSVGGAALGFLGGGAQGAAMGMLAPQLSEALAGRVLMSKLAQGYLGNQKMTELGLSGIGPGPIPGLLGSYQTLDENKPRRGLLSTY
jgi:hypothetical protein